MPDSYNDRSSPNGPVGSTGGKSFPNRPAPGTSAHGYPNLAQQTDGTAPLASPVETKDAPNLSTPSGSGKRYWPPTVTSYPDGD